MTPESSVPGAVGEPRTEAGRALVGATNDVLLGPTGGWTGTIQVSREFLIDRILAIEQEASGGAVGEREEPPIAGMWVVESAADLTPEIMERVKDQLVSAAENGEEIVVADGIEFRWRPTRIDTATLDVERLAEAFHMSQLCVHGIGAGEPMQKAGYLNPDQEAARLIADEYARLSVNEGGPPEADDPWSGGGIDFGKREVYPPGSRARVEPQEPR